MKTRTVVKVAAGHGNLELEERHLDRPGAGQVLLRIRRAAICGTDLHIYRWNEWAARNYRVPLVLGHEFCGEVLELGPGVTGLREGQRVSGETHIFCGTCDQCRSNRRHTCSRLQLFSKSGYGCFCDYTIVPANALRIVPDHLSLNEAAVLEPLGVGIRAATAAGISGKSLLVTGCGPIGLYTIAAARALGACEIFAADLSPRRLDMARQVGADMSVDVAGMENGTVDAVIDATGNASLIEAALSVIRPGGTMLLVGLPERPLALQAGHVINREIAVKGIYGRLIDETWLSAERLLAAGRLPIDRIETCEFPVTQFKDAFECALSGTTGKVIFNLDA